MVKYLKTLRKLLVWALILAVIALTIFYFAQDLITFPGRGLYTSNPGEWQARVANLGAQGYIPVDFPGPAGHTIKGLWAPCAPTSGPAILWLHSRVQTITEINQHIRPLTQAGFHVFAMEYRGYGANTGETTEAGILADAEEAVEWMGKHESVAGKRVFVGGYELGANLAFKVALRAPVHGIVALSILPDMQTAVAAKIPWVPLGFLLKEKFELMSVLSEVTAPVFIIHGTEDRIVPMAVIEQIMGRLPGQPRLREVAGAGNEDALEKGGKDLTDELDRWKDRPR